LEGLGFRSIGRFCGVSNVSVLNWIKNFGEEIQTLHSASKIIGVVEVDEIYTYIGKKNYCWIWIAVDRYGKRFINFTIGSRGNETVSEFWSKISHIEMNYGASDY